MGPSPDPPLVLFDGLCNLCEAGVQFILRRDKAGRFRFASLQSKTGAELLSRQGIPPDRRLETMLLVLDGRTYARSGAALRIARRMDFPWPLLSIFLAVPTPIRDFVYGVIARHRYRWFGKREACWLPTPELQSRFLD